jgi:flagellar protein FlaJ
MKTVKIPFLPVGAKRAKIIARHYLGWGEGFSKMFRSLEWELEQGRFDFEPREWAALALFSFINYFLILFASLSVILFVAGISIRITLSISLLAGMSIGFGVFMFQMSYPKLFLSRKVKGIEKNLSVALHHLLIHIRSGVPLFSALISISKSGYGVLSKEFERAVVEMNTGASEVKALEMLARKNPSMHFRRVMWQIVNAIKSGADIGKTIKEIVDNLVIEQRTDIKKYGAELNPMALFYMILVVIFPTMGIIFLIVLFSFVGALMNIEMIMIGILAFLLVFQVMFIGMIKSKRPTGI